MSELIARIAALRAELRSVTPLKTDCGELCGGFCCKGGERVGDDGDYGMLLFPGEETFFRRADGYELSAQLASDGGSLSFVCCTKPCERRFRPLSCMIFPLIPYLPPECRTPASARGALTAVPDSRAAWLCPLVRGGQDGTDRRFSRAVVKAFEKQLDCPRIFDFICRLSRTSDDYSRFV